MCLVTWQVEVKQTNKQTIKHKQTEKQKTNNKQTHICQVTWQVEVRGSCLVLTQTPPDPFSYG